ncbi:hypothetical protein [Reyranella sp.]|uniref:hypothetical protein n=1 Tax=Reyranella sp. TaxID=1929291 RepID=UPI003BACBE5F
MFELEKDERIRGIEPTEAALAMGFAHDFVLELMLTREMLEMGPAEATKLSRLMIERWNRRYGSALADPTSTDAEKSRQFYATKAFVDRLARKALHRSDSIRPSAEVSTVTISDEMKQAGAAALSEFKHLPPEELVAAIYGAMSNRG